MAFFDQLYQKLFSGKADGPSKILHEVIDRSGKYLASYSEWKTNGGSSAMLSAYGRAYHFKRSGIQSSPNVHVFATKMSNGFALSYSNEFDRQEFQFLFDLLAEKARALGYRLVNSDVQIGEKGDVIETREKHYLKPPQTRGVKKIDQQFGNILVEYVMVNDQPSYIKLLANIYSDRLYKEPDDHQDLIAHLFQPIDNDK